MKPTDCRTALFSLLLFAPGCSKSAGGAGVETDPFAAAVAKHEAGDLEGAIADYDRLLKADNEHGGALMNRSVAHLELGHFDAALSDANRALILDPKDAEAHLQRARVLLARNSEEEALGSLEAALDIDPLLAEAFETRADCWVNLGEWAAAVVDYSNAIRLEPNRVPLWIARSEAQRFLNHEDEAAMDRLFAGLTQTMLDADKDPAAAMARGLAFLERDEPELAFDDLSKALELDPNLETAFLARAHTRLLLGDDAGALGDYSSWIQEHPAQSSEALTARAVLYTLLGSDREAIKDLEKALAQTPNNHQARADLAWLLATTQQPGAKDPARSLELALGLPEDPSEPWRPSEIKAAAYASLGDSVAAGTALVEAILHAPNEEVAEVLRKRQAALGSR